MKNLPIKVVVATKLRQEDFLTQSAAGKSIENFFKTSQVQLHIFPENKLGLPIVYNQVIEESTDDVILVFIHDDVFIFDFYWADQIRTGLDKFDLVGVVGNTRRTPNQAGWILLADSRLDDPQYLSGAIGQGVISSAKLDYFGPVGRECKLMDGVFFAATSAKLKESKLRFDPQFSFHFYDMDFCRSAESLGVKMGTIPLSLIHESYGSMDNQWYDAYRAYLQKWGG